MPTPTVEAKVIKPGKAGKTALMSRSVCCKRPKVGQSPAQLGQAQVQAQAAAKAAKPDAERKSAKLAQAMWRQSQRQTDGSKRPAEPLAPGPQAAQRRPVLPISDAKAPHQVVHAPTAKRLKSTSSGSGL